MARIAEEISQGPRCGPGLVGTPEWQSVCRRQLNVMIEGPEHATEGLLALLQGYLRTPAIWKRAPMSLELALELAPDECRALVVQNVSALDRHEQAALAKWLDVPNDPKQVVSTTVHPLFPLVDSGLFDEFLYYRLTVTLLRLDAAGVPAWQNGARTGP